LEAAVRTFDKSGARLQLGWPAGFSFAEMFSTYLVMLMAFNFSVASPAEQVQQRAEFAAHKGDERANASLNDFASWHRYNLRRLAFRAAWQHYFQDMDAFLLSVLPVSAFPHDHTEKDSRKLGTPEGPLPYMKALRTYASVATLLTGCPATVAPAGRTANGLPVGIQIMGPYLEDATPIQLAGLFARENGGFTPPPGY
jgi:amidase